MSLTMVKNAIVKTSVVLAVVAAGVWAYYANVASGRPTMDMNMRVTAGNTPFPVTAAIAERGRITGAVTYTGSVVPFNEEDVYPRVTGLIVEMSVYPGDFVRAGQVVARLDNLELTSRVLEAEAMAANALANRSQMDADVAGARYGIAQMETELAVAEAEAGYQQSVAARDEQLLTKGAVAKQDAESSRAMAVAAQAKVQAARARVEQAKAMETSALRRQEAADAMVAQGQAQAKTAQVVRDYVNIRATTSGYVVKRLVAPGVLVQPGMPVLKIVQTDKVRLQANVGEKDLASIRVGSPVIVTTTASVQPPISALVTSVFPFVDQGARTGVVEAVVENADRRLLSGQYVQMQFVTGGRADALSAPQGAVARMGGKATVWVVKEDRAEPIEVTTGLENPERVEILTGLVGGERIVAKGHEGLYAGARVSDVSSSKPSPQEGADAHKGIPGIGAAPAKAKESGKASDMKDMPGQRAETKVAQAVGPAPAAGILQINLSTNPVKLSSGNARLRIEVKDATGAPVSDAKVEVSAGMSGMAVPKTAARAAKEAGVYEATLKLGMAGGWTVEVTAAQPQGGPTSSKFTLEAK